MTWLVVAVGLLLLIFLHELGHFTAALAVGNRPRGFYVGFGPKLASFTRNGIEYGLRLIPAGGYVRLPGMHRPAAKDIETFLSPALREQPGLAATVQPIRRALEAEDFATAAALLPALRAEVATAELTPSAQRPANRAVRDIDDGTSSDAYWRQPPWKRIVVIAAGPAMNILVAFVIFVAVYATGAPSQSLASTTAAAVQSNSPAAKAGLQVGDKLIAVNGHSAKTFDRLSALIRASHGRPITVTVDRAGRKLTLGPRATRKSNGRWVFGFTPAAALVSYPLAKSARLAADDCWRVFTGTVSAFGGLIHKKERGQLTSAVGIVKVSNEALRVGFNYYLQIVGFVSMSLALLNLLPFLPLDGGHIVFSLVEAVRRRSVAREVYERVSVVGFALIMLIFFIALQNDVGRYLPG
jgi:regulator of sigma E protease